MPPQRRNSFRRGLWRLADPKISLASFASIFLGLSTAAADGPLHWGWAAATLVGIFCIEVAKNASGEIYDFDSGADPGVRPENRSPFSGGKRVLVDRLLTRRQTWGIALAFYGAGIAFGLWIVVAREPRVLWLGLAGLVLAFFYQAPPLRLSYRGLGEIAVALAYGPILCAGTYLVQRGSVSLEVCLLALPLGLLIAAFLWINELPDRRADAAAGKKTLVVRLGPRGAARGFALLCAGALALALALPATGSTPWIWLGLAAAPFAAAASYRLLQDPETTARIIPAQAWTLLAFLLYAAGAGAGVLLGAGPLG